MRGPKNILAAVACMGLLVSMCAREARADPVDRRAAIVELRGSIDDVNYDGFVKRVQRARAAGASTIIVDLDTYGGLVTSGMNISRFIKNQEKDNLHFIAFVNTKAISAGAMIALACDEIVMNRSAILGDCAPIIVTDQGLQSMGAAERAKMESPIVADFDESAQGKYDQLLVRSMVSVQTVVHWVQNAAGERKFVDDAGFAALDKSAWKTVPGYSDPLDSSTSLLTVSTHEAIELGLAKGQAPTAGALVRERGLTLVGSFTASGFDGLVEFLGGSLVRMFLLALFLTSLYAAFHVPGHGVAELLCGSALVALMGVPLMTGYAQWWEIVAVVVGLALIAIEVFIIPGFGAAGVIGIITLLVGILGTFVPKEPDMPGFLPRLPATWASIKNGLLVTTGGLILSMVLSTILRRWLPRMPYFNRLILAAPSGGPAVTRESLSSAFPAVGMIGVALTELKPGGSVEFHTHEGAPRALPVVSDSGFVDRGASVVVREVHGNRTVVRELVSKA